MYKVFHRSAVKVFAALAIVSVMATAAYATPITGGISLAGLYATNTSNINTATAFTAFSLVQVTSVTGSFVGVTVGVPGSVTMMPFSFAPFPVGGVVPLWFTVLGSFASFDFTSLTSTIHIPDALTLVGSGILHRTGFDATPGTYIATFNQAGGTFSFSSSNAAIAIPEPGILSLLGLGLGLLGMYTARRRLS